MYRLDTFQEEIWLNNYKAPEDKIIEDTWKRVARGAVVNERARIRKDVERQFYDILYGFKFVPGGRIVANIGTSRLGTTLMNCYAWFTGDRKQTKVDSMENIAHEIYVQMKTLASEGGYGTNFGWMRPRGSLIKKIGVLHPGVVAYMELWDKASKVITQGADAPRGKVGDIKLLKKKIRKGAMMGVLPVWHPDIIDFIEAKATPNQLTKFNLSVGITKGFMEAVINNDEWKLVFPDTDHPKYDTEWNGDISKWEYQVVTYEIVKARELWDKITFATYTRNEPGIMFLDLANQLNPFAYGEKILQSNPCGEIMMSTGCCNLGSINLTQFVQFNDQTYKFYFDWHDFETTVKTSIRFLDNVNDISRNPLPEYDDSMRNKRRVGLGVMGLGSIHFMMGMKYGSKESLDFVKTLFRTKAQQELIASAELGREKGSFPLFNRKEYFSSYWWKNLEINESVKNNVMKLGAMRNSHRSANAPTGTTGILAGVVSGGIEPVFMKEYTRWVIVTPAEKKLLRDQGMEIPDTGKGEWYETKHLHFAQRGDEQILEGPFREGTYNCDRNRGLTKSVDVRDYGFQFRHDHKNLIEDIHFDGGTATALPIAAHLDVLKIISHYTDMNSSKTINIPADTSFEDFKSVYISAYNARIKGLTTYREGSMAAVLEAKKIANSEQKSLAQVFTEYGDKVIKKLDTKLPTEYPLKGFIIRDAQTKNKYYINVACVDNALTKPYAIFVTTNNKEPSRIANETIELIEELAKRKGVMEDFIKDQHTKYKEQENTDKIARAIGFCLRHNIAIPDIVEQLEEGKYPLSSLVFHIKKILLKFVPDGTEIKGRKCEECGGKLVYTSGCDTCLQCGTGKCT
jgi:ribonucleoside-diphosphate reductase alpha chain